MTSTTTDLVLVATATSELLPDHYATLLGERPAGSRWGRDFTEADFELPWVDATDDLPAELQFGGCRYFRLSGDAFIAAFPDAFVGAVALKDLPAELVSTVRVVEGAHGVELHADFPAGFGELTRTDEAWLIVGKEGDDDVVFTAYPGPVLAPLDKSATTPPTVDESPLVAVKLEASA